MNELDMQRADKLVEWLNEKYTEYIVKERVRSQRVPSQNNFAIYCGVSTSNMSAWMNKHRLPAGENLDRLATKLGLEIYDILNIPPRLPKDKWLLKIARQWHKLPEDLKRELWERVDNATFDDDPRRAPKPVNP